VDVLFARARARGREDPPLTRDDIARYAAAIQVPNEEELALYHRAIVIQT